MSSHTSFVILLMACCLISRTVLATSITSTIYGWGANPYGQLGLGSATTTTILSPVRITIFNSVNITNIALSSSNAYSIASSGYVYVSGNNVNGQLNYLASSTPQNTPVASVNITSAFSIYPGGAYTVAVIQGSTPYWPVNSLVGWGLTAGYVEGVTSSNKYAQIQSDSPGYQFDGNVVGAGTAASTTYVILSNGTVWSAGNGYPGLLGTSVLVPVYQFAEITYFRLHNISISRFITGQSNHTCALAVNGSLYCWGSNNVGQLGLNDTSDRAIPFRVNFFDDNGYILYKVRLGGSHTVALTCGGAVFIWGANQYGQQGVGAVDTGAHPVPSQLVAFNGLSAVDIEASLYQTYVRTSNGWYVWGGGTNGALGTTYATSSSNPTHPDLWQPTLNPNFANFTTIFSASTTLTLFGLTGFPTQNLTGCPALVNECANGNNTCSNVSVCADTERGYLCQCTNGWIGDGHIIADGGTSCKDPNVCRAGYSQCLSQATCVSTGGLQYYCVCPTGYSGDGKSGGTGCNDINECTVGGYCSVNAVCQNTVGSYSCTCDSGYFGDGHTAAQNGTDCTVICPTGQYASNQTTCTSCAVGTYNDQTGKTSCSSCPYGTYNAVGGAKTAGSCIPCANGTYSGVGSAFCYPCPYGQTTLSYQVTGLRSNASACFSCPVGTYGSYGSCIPCPAGTWANSLGATQCMTCPAGQYSPINGSTSCSVCPAGSYSIGGTAGCPSCAAGTYSTGPGSSECLRCPLGTSTSGAPAQTSCTPCQKGYFQPKLGGGSCVICGKGYYSTANSSACLPCPSGSYTSLNGASTCTPCAVNTYATSIFSVTCAACPFGTYTPSTGASECLPCPVGFYRNTTQSTCLPCAPGSYQNTIGSTTCYTCPAGSYASAPNSTYCKKCPLNTISDAGFATCTACPAGKTSAGAGSVCS